MAYAQDSKKRTPMLSFIVKVVLEKINLHFQNYAGLNPNGTLFTEHNVKRIWRKCESYTSKTAIKIWAIGNLQFLSHVWDFGGFAAWAFLFFA